MYIMTNRMYPAHQTSTFVGNEPLAGPVKTTNFFKQIGLFDFQSLDIFLCIITSFNLYNLSLQFVNRFSDLQIKGRGYNWFQSRGNMWK